MLNRDSSYGAKSKNYCRSIHNQFQSWEPFASLSVLPGYFFGLSATDFKVVFDIHAQFLPHLNHQCQLHPYSINPNHHLANLLLLLPLLKYSCSSYQSVRLLFVHCAIEFWYHLQVLHYLIKISWRMVLKVLHLSSKSIFLVLKRPGSLFPINV